MYLNSHVKRIHPHTRRPHLLSLDYISRIKLTAKAWRGLRDGEADIRNESDPAAFISQHTLTPLLFSLLHPYLTTIDFPLLLPPSLHLSIMLSTIFSPGGIRFRMLLCVDIQVWPLEYFSLWEEKNSGSVRMCTCSTSKCVWCKAFIVLHKLSTYLSSSPLFYPSLHTLSLYHTHTNTLSLFPL